MMVNEINGKYRREDPDGRMFGTHRKENTIFDVACDGEKRMSFVMAAIDRQTEKEEETVFVHTLACVSYKIARTGQGRPSTAVRIFRARSNEIHVCFTRPE